MSFMNNSLMPKSFTQPNLADYHKPINFKPKTEIKKEESLFTILNKISEDKSKKNAYNYYYYKLFDFNGELLDFNSFEYQNMNKIELFIENVKEKEKYNLAMSCDDSVIESEEDYIKNENFFGPQRSIVY